MSQVVMVVGSSPMLGCCVVKVTWAKKEEQLSWDSEMRITYLLPPSSVELGWNQVRLQAGKW